MIWNEQIRLFFDGTQNLLQRTDIEFSSDALILDRRLFSPRRVKSHVQFLGVLFRLQKNLLVSRPPTESTSKSTPVAPGNRELPSSPFFGT